MRVASTNFPFQSKSTAQAGLGRKLATAFIFVAFLLQSFVTQTHMHMGLGAFPSITQIASKQIHHAPALPGNPDDAVNCPLCQAITHASAYFSPIVLDTLVRHMQDGSPPAIAARDMRTDYHGHSKQQRGPPSL